MDDQQQKFNRNRLGVLAFLLLLVLLILFLIWWWFLRGVSQPVTTPVELSPEDTVILPQQKSVVTAVPVEGVTPLSAGELEIMALARNFAERYGSFSTESNFQNLKELYPRMTARLRADLESIVAAEVIPAVFKGVETRVVNIQITSLGDTEANVLVTTQRVSSNADLLQVVSYEPLQLTMVKHSDFWYVDSARWLAK